jgi:uncharacterized coiled-coil protein SlyX
MMEQELYNRIARLEARMGQMELLIQRLLTLLSTSHDSIGQTTQLQLLRQELEGTLDPYAPGRAGLGPAEGTPGASWQQQPQQNPAIWNALMAGDKIKAIKLYREQYGVDLVTAKNAVDAIERSGRGY